MDSGLDILSVQISDSEVIQQLILRFDEREDPLERGVSNNEVLVEIIRINGRLSAIEAKVFNLLIFLTDFSGGLSVKLGASLRVLLSGTVVRNPLGVHIVRDERVPVVVVHNDITFIKRSTRHDWVTDHQTSELLVDVAGRVLEDLVRESGDIDTTIALAIQPGRAANILGESVQKAFKKLEVIVRGLLVSSLVLVSTDSAERKADTTRLLQVHNVGELVPGELCENDGSVLQNTERTVLFEQTQQTTAPRTTLVPEHKRIILRMGTLAFDQPIENVSLFSSVHGDVTSVRLERESRTNIAWECGSGNLIRTTERARSRSDKRNTQKGKEKRKHHSRERQTEKSPSEK